MQPIGKSVGRDEGRIFHNAADQVATDLVTTISSQTVLRRENLSFRAAES